MLTASRARPQVRNGDQAHRRTLVRGALADAGITALGAGDAMRRVAEPAA